MPVVTLSDIYLSHGSWRLKGMKIVDFLFGGLLAFFLSAKTGRAISGKAIRKILVIRPGGIGDAVFLLPFLKSLKSQGISIDVLCEPRNADIFISQNYPVLFYTRWKDIWQASRTFYDCVIDTEQWHYISAIISYYMKTECRISFATRPLRAKMFDRRVEYAGDDYELHNFAKIFEDLMPPQVPINNIDGCLDIAKPLQIWASAQIPEHSVTVFIGASIVLRRLPDEPLLAVLRELLSQGISPVLLGGADVTTLADSIMKNINEPKILNFVGKTSLIESAALIQRSRKFIGPDSGMMHIACAVGTPVTAIFGPGNVKKWGPQGNNHYVATKNVSCSPCTQFGYTVPTCHKSYHCMQDIKALIH